MHNSEQQTLHVLSAPDKYWHFVKSMAYRCFEYDNKWDQIEDQRLKWGKNAFENRYYYYFEDYAEGLDFMNTKNWKWNADQFKSDCRRQFEKYKENK